MSVSTTSPRYSWNEAHQENWQRCTAQRTAIRGRARQGRHCLGPRQPALESCSAGARWHRAIECHGVSTYARNLDETKGWVHAASVPGQQGRGSRRTRTRKKQRAQPNTQHIFLAPPGHNMVAWPAVNGTQGVRPEAESFCCRGHSSCRSLVEDKKCYLSLPMHCGWRRLMERLSRANELVGRLPHES